MNWHNTVNRERFARLNFHAFHGLKSTVKVFNEYKCLSLIILSTFGQGNVFHENFSRVETANI